MRPPDGADWLCALTIEVPTGATMEVPPEEEQGRVQSQHRASRARRPVFEQRAAIVGATVVVGLVIYLTVTVQHPQARSIFEFVLLLFCIPLAVALLLSLLRGVFERS